MNEKTKNEIAVAARARVSLLRTLVDGAYEAWAKAVLAADPDAIITNITDPEVEWDSPKSEHEAALDLEAARLGGELAAAKLALGSAATFAAKAQREAMVQAARDGRLAWEKAYLD